MEYPTCQGHHDCTEKECFSKTMIDKGSCDCLYKASCHLMRQRLQAEFREKYGWKLTDCDFYKVLKPIYDKSSLEKEE